MAFAQLTRRKSLRGMETCLQTLDAELCHTIANSRLAACWPVPAQSATGASLPTSLKPSFSRRPLARTVCRRIPANRPCAGLSDQQLHRTSVGYCTTLPPRWHIELISKESSNLGATKPSTAPARTPCAPKAGLRFRLPAGGQSQKTSASRLEPLHDVADFKSKLFEKTPVLQVLS